MSTIHEDLFDELYFLQRYDELKMELQQLIDMPDKRLSSVIIYLHQNKGKFPNRRKNQLRRLQRKNLGRWKKFIKIFLTVDCSLSGGSYRRLSGKHECLKKYLYAYV